MAAVLLVGCGKMGSALLTGWRDALPETKFITIDPVSALADYRSIEDFAQAHDTMPDPVDAVILAVKPQQMDELLPALSGMLPESTFVLSIAAGKSLSYFARALNDTTPVIRAMPNTPAAIGRGMSVMVANSTVSNAQKNLATRLMAAAGATAWIEDESLMDAVTALSGSGPAYLFHMVEALTDAGEKIGLPRELAALLARQTVTGAARLMEAEHETPPATLRQNVTSPNGTTEAALRILMDHETGLTDLMTRTLIAARDRSRAL